jgi:hypothetical protein
MIFFFSTIAWVVFYLVLLPINILNPGLINFIMVHPTNGFGLSNTVFSLIVSFGSYLIIALLALLLFGRTAQSINDRGSFWYNFMKYAFLGNEKWPLLFIICAFISSVLSALLMYQGKVNPSFFALSIIIFIGMLSNYSWSRIFGSTESNSSLNTD